MSRVVGDQARSYGARARLLSHQPARVTKINIARYARRHGLRKTVKKAGRRIRQKVRNTFHQAVGSEWVRSDYGVNMRANWDDLSFRFQVDAFFGYFLFDYIAGISRPFIFLDVGANQGLYSLIAAQNPHCLRVVCFEPVRSSYDLLAENIQLNPNADKIVPVRAAISSTGGREQIHVKEGHSGAASFHSDFHAGSKGVEEIDVLASEGIEALVPQGGVVVVKIDTEGHEKIVIEELGKGAFFDRVASIFYEINEQWSDAAAIKAILETYGFDNFQIIGEGTRYDVLASRGAAISDATSHREMF